jgi:hypothetical protein
MSTSNPIPTLGTVRTALQGIAPAFIRGTIPIDIAGKPSLPDDAFVLDLITTIVTPDYDSEYATVQLQVGAWSTSLGTARVMADQAIAALAPLLWRVTGFGPTLEDAQYRGVVVTLERQQ